MATHPVPGTSPGPPPGPQPPPLRTLTATESAGPDEAVLRGWATRWADLRGLIERHGPDDATPVIIIRRGGGVWVIDSVRRASDGAIELTVRPS